MKYAATSINDRRDIDEASSSVRDRPWVLTYEFVRWGMIKRSIRSGATVLDQQIELVAKLFNDPFELPTTLEDGRSDAEDGG